MSRLQIIWQWVQMALMIGLLLLSVTLALLERYEPATYLLGIAIFLVVVDNRNNG